MAGDASLTDEALVAAYRNGAQWAAGMLVERYAAKLGRFLYTRGAPEADLEDLTQEAFFKAFRSLEGWRGEATFRSWLYRIALNLGRDAWRKGRKRTQVTLEHEIPSTDGNPESLFEAQETGRRILRELGTLPRLQRDVFILRAQQGMNYAEIAQALNTTEGAARVHYHHALRRLKEAVA